MRTIRIFDTTLRDGEQAAGGALTLEEKMEVGRQLERLGVTVIEAGFPSTSPGDFEAVTRMSRELHDVEIAALSGFRDYQIERTWEALQDAERPLLHTVISTSDVHLQNQLNMTREEVVELTRNTVELARRRCPHVEFSTMDATRTDPDYLVQVLATAIAAGATVVNIPDTVGYSMPGEFGSLVAYCMENVPGIDEVIVSVHCHDDLGHAVANSLAGVMQGVAQVECTINGVGERAGNASLEEIVMALRTRSDFYAADTAIDAREFYRTSRLVSNLMGMPVPPNKAIVGANAFAHSSGLHQDGMLKNSVNYEIMRPEDVGHHSSRIVLGKFSGRHAFRNHLRMMGVDIPDEDFQDVFDEFKRVADRKKEITDQELEAIVGARMRLQRQQRFKLELVQVSCGTFGVPTATVRIQVDDEPVQVAAMGDGPVDAVYKAIMSATGMDVELTDFSISAVSESPDALGEVVIRVEQGDRAATGHGVDTDILVASAHAFVSGLNRLTADVSVGRVPLQHSV
ncbi:MAG: 2-isopropylmalate synthase [Chloroflexi bacterium]|nr:2-isopropylmalate synthase [Chloroflexota bacterium]